MQKAVAAYGCFVDIGASTDGLVHISQLSSGYVKDVNSFVKVGQNVLVKVLGVEGENKIALSMKTQADEGTAPLPTPAHPCPPPAGIITMVYPYYVWSLAVHGYNYMCIRQVVLLRCGYVPTWHYLI